MSEPVPPPREWRFDVDDMLAFCDKVLLYAKGLERESFATDPMRYALARLLAA